MTADIMVTVPDVMTEREFTTMYGRYNNMIRQAVFSYASDLSEADDLVQAVFTKAWEKREQFRGEATAGTWLHAIATNVAKNWVRDSGRRPVMIPASTLYVQDGDSGMEESWLEQHAVEYDTPELLAIAEETEELLGSAAARLPDALRRVYVLHWLDNNAPAEIAERMDMGVDTIHRYISRIREHLSKEV